MLRLSKCGEFTLRKFKRACVLTVALLSFAAGQDSNVPSDALAMFAQLKILTNDLADGLGVRQGQFYAVHVEADRQKTVMENLLAEVFRERGAMVRLEIDSATAGDSLLRVVLLAHEATRRESDEGVLRNIETVMNARIETRTGEILVQKTFRKFSTDTLRTARWTENASVLERLLEPAVVIGGAILVVFLLFTVRSS